ADDVTEADCLAQDGVYFGDDSSCGETEEPCPPRGACCFGGTVAGLGTGCGLLTEDDCAKAGGDFQGVGVRCTPDPCEDRAHPGWNWVDNLIMLTKNEPAYWSAATGQPKGVSPFTVLDPAGPGQRPGRPDPDGTEDRVLRGYVIAYAINADGAEIRWNHLKGDVTIVDYREGNAWEYNAYGFAVVDNGVANGAATGSPGTLNLDGVEYAPCFDQLLLDFQSTRPGWDTDLTLLPVDVDLRQETDGPVTTKAHFDIWNESEVKFSGAYRCITCWDQWLLSRHGLPNHFLQVNLQSDKGRARIDGLASQLCDDDNDPKDQKPLGDDLNDIVSRDAALLGVAAKIIEFAPQTPRARAGGNLHGLGTQPAVIRVDTLGPPPEATGPEQIEQLLLDLVRLAGLDDAAPRSRRAEATAQGTVAGAPGVDRVSATEKGSLLVFPKIEIRWDRDGNRVQDSFVDLSNDYPEDVRVQMYFINGDPPVSPKDDVKEPGPF
ncbi:MAG: hypothetical protein ACYTJ0_18230, partial [Planctomycetota bacterium]